MMLARRLAIDFSFVPEVEHNHAVIFENTREGRPQMGMKSGVVTKPPKGRPPEDDEGCTCLTEAFQFPYRCLVVWRRPPVFAVLFQEGDGMTGNDEILAPLRFVHE